MKHEIYNKRSHALAFPVGRLFNALSISSSDNTGSVSNLS